MRFLHRRQFHLLPLIFSSSHRRDVDAFAHLNVLSCCCYRYHRSEEEDGNGSGRLRRRGWRRGRSGAVVKRGRRCETCCGMASRLCWRTGCCPSPPTHPHHLPLTPHKTLKPNQPSVPQWLLYSGDTRWQRVGSADNVSLCAA